MNKIDELDLTGEKVAIEEARKNHQHRITQAQDLRLFEYLRVIQVVGAISSLSASIYEFYMRSKINRFYDKEKQEVEK